MTGDTKKRVAESSRELEASMTDMAKTLAERAKELELLQAYTKALADQLKVSDAKTLADQVRAWKALTENAKTLGEQVKALAATKADNKTLADQATAWKVLHDYTKTISEQARALEATTPDTSTTLSDYLRAALGRNARAFGDGFTSVLSPSFHLWLENDDYKSSYAVKHSSLREIWKQVGQHIDDAASVVVISKHGQRAKEREG